MYTYLNTNIHTYTHVHIYISMFIAYCCRPGKGGILQGQPVVLPSHATPTQPLLADLARSNLNNGSDTPVVGNVTLTRQQLMYPAVTKQQQTNPTVTKSVRPKGILSTPSKPASSNRQDKSTTAKTVTKKTQNVISNQSGQSQGIVCNQNGFMQYM